MDYDPFLREVAPLLDLEWRKYRRRSARRAVEARLRELGMADLQEYLQRIRTDPAEARALPDRMRVTVSRFLRDRQRWSILFDAVVPEVLPSDDGGKFRAWSAGCCGGEEPYTFSLLWRDRVAPARPDLALDVLATDIDPPSLDRAARATYDTGSLREVPEGARSRWFTKAGGRWKVREAAREPVRLVRHNLLTDSVPEGRDLVLCRYLVFTYYREGRRDEAVVRLHRSLRPGGALMIGRKEGLTPRDQEWFAPWPGAPGVFRRRDADPAVGG